MPEYGATEEYLTGSHIWRSGDGESWSRVTGNGFGDEEIVAFEGFADFDGTLYVSGSKGASSSSTGIAGAKIFRMADTLPPDILKVSTNQLSEDTYIPLYDGACFPLNSMHILWTSRDIVFECAPCDWGCRLGVEHTYFSHKPTTDMVWQPEIETNLYDSPLGYYGQWSWVNPLPLIGTEGNYDIRLAAEDAAGNRSEVTYQITIDTTDADADGAPDCIDNCLAACNPLQLDADLDGLGDLCDPEPNCGEGCQSACEEPCPDP